MVDGASEGLAPRTLPEISKLPGEVARRGWSALLVENKLDIALQLSQRVYVMDHGQIVFEGSPPALMQDQQRCNEWLGV